MVSSASRWPGSAPGGRQGGSGAGRRAHTWLQADSAAAMLSECASVLSAESVLLRAVRDVGFRFDVLEAPDPQEPVEGDRAVMEGQLSAADEPRDPGLRVRASETRKAGSAPVGGELPTRDMEWKIPVDVDIVAGDDHDAMEVERQQADCEIHKSADDGDELGDVLGHAEDNHREQVVEGERHGDSLLVQVGAARYALRHPLVVPRDGDLTGADVRAAARPLLRRLCIHRAIMSARSRIRRLNGKKSVKDLCS